MAYGCSGTQYGVFKGYHDGNIIQGHCKAVDTGDTRNRQREIFKYVVRFVRNVDIPSDGISVFKIGMPYWSMFIVQIFCAIMSSILEIWSLRRLFKFSIMNYVKTAYCRPFGVAVVSAVLPVVAAELLSDNFLDSIFVMLVSILSAVVCIYYLGLSKRIRAMIKAKVRGKIVKIFNS